MRKTQGNWNGCEGSFKGAMPGGWRYYIEYHGTAPIGPRWGDTVDLEKVPGFNSYALCPRHVVTLRMLLGWNADQIDFSMPADGHTPTFAQPKTPKAKLRITA